jgi:hypothetical protein
MAERRYVTVHFTDGNKLTISFEQQVSTELVASKLREALEARQFSFEADGDLFVLPTSSIKYMQVSPAPARLPDSVVKGARIVAT